MKRFDPRIALGFLLLVGGVLALMQTMGYLKNAPDIFWGGLFLALGWYFSRFSSAVIGGARSLALHWWHLAY